MLESNLKVALDLAENCYAAYLSAPAHVRRWFNQTFFTRILITDEDANGELTGAIQSVTKAATRTRNRKDGNEARPRDSLGRGSDSIWWIQGDSNP